MFARMMHLRLHCHVVDSLLWHAVEFWKLEALNLAEKAMRRLTNSLDPGLEDQLWNRTAAFQHLVIWCIRACLETWLKWTSAFEKMESRSDMAFEKDVYESKMQLLIKNWFSYMFGRFVRSCSRAPCSCVDACHSLCESARTNGCGDLASGWWSRFCYRGDPEGNAYCKATVVTTRNLESWDFCGLPDLRIQAFACICHYGLHYQSIFITNPSQPSSAGNQPW